MNPKEILKEILYSIWAMKASAFLILGISILITSGTLLTVGRSAAAMQQLQSRLQDLSARTITFTETSETKLFKPQITRVLASATSVESILNTSLTFDVSNTATGKNKEPISAQLVRGNLKTHYELIAGRWPKATEAIINSTALPQLGLKGIYGSVTDTQTGQTAAIVGAFKPRYQNTQTVDVLIGAKLSQNLPVHKIITRDYRKNQQVTNQALNLIGVHNPDLIHIQQPPDIQELSANITADLTKYSQETLYLTLIAAAVISALVVFADALSKRADLGRRLALGATKKFIIIYTLGRVVIPVIIGTIIGLLAGVTATYYTGGSISGKFIIGLIILILLTMSLAALPGAIWASKQDPVKILRLP